MALLSVPGYPCDVIEHVHSVCGLLRWGWKRHGYQSSPEGTPSSSILANPPPFMRALVPGRRTAWFYLVSGTNRQFSSAKQGSGSDGGGREKMRQQSRQGGENVSLSLSLCLCLGPTGRQLCDRRSAIALPSSILFPFPSESFLFYLFTRDKYSSGEGIYLSVYL